MHVLGNLNFLCPRMRKIRTGLYLSSCDSNAVYNPTAAPSHDAGPFDTLTDMLSVNAAAAVATVVVAVVPVLMGSMGHGGSSHRWISCAWVWDTANLCQWSSGLLRSCGGSSAVSEVTGLVNVFALIAAVDNGTVNRPATRPPVQLTGSSAQSASLMHSGSAFPAHDSNAWAAFGASNKCQLRREQDRADRSRNVHQERLTFSNTVPKHADISCLGECIPRPPQGVGMAHAPRFLVPRACASANEFELLLLTLVILSSKSCNLAISLEKIVDTCTSMLKSA